MITARTACLTALMLIAVAGTEARAALPGAPTKPPLGTPLLVAASGIAAIATAIAIWSLLRPIRLRRRRRPEDRRQIVVMPPSRLSQILALLFCITLLSAPIIAVLFLHTGGRGHRAQQGTTNTFAPTRGAQTAHRGVASQSSGGGSNGELIALVVVAALVVIAVLLLARHRVDADSESPSMTNDETDRVAAVAVAAREGRAAMVGIGDARAAIIACYTAMEAHLAAGGVRRAVADTQTELLHAAIGHGLVARAPAARLTRLFERARFGVEQLTDADRQHAEHLLTELGAQHGKTTEAAR